MKKARLIEQNTKKDKKELNKVEDFTVKTKVITAVLMLLALVGMYFVTIPLTKNKKTNGTSNSNKNINVRKENTIKYSEISKIKDESYYLFFDKKDDDLNNTYDTYINSLANSNYPVNFYYIDLSDEANKDLLDKDEKLEKLSEIKVKDTTLLLIDDKEIKSKYVGQSEVSNYLLSFFIQASNVTIKTSSNSNSNSNEKTEDKKEDKDDDKKDNEKKEEKSENDED